MYRRLLEDQLKYWLKSERQKVIILYGARQVGKTTLARKVAGEIEPNYSYIDCGDLLNQNILNSRSIQELRNFVGDSKLLILDEGQEVEHIGIALKLIHDHIPQVRVLVTGSSSFELANKVSEPLTGRNVKLELFPLSLKELSQSQNMFTLASKFNTIMRFGTYPDVVDLGESLAIKTLKDILNDYIYKDTLRLADVRKPLQFKDLLVVLANSIGQTTTYNDLGRKIGADRETVERYIDVLEKAFIIKRLRPLHRSHVREIMHPFKIYFYDLGVRNALIGEYKPLNLRSGNEIGAMWENFCIIERMKLNEYGNSEKEETQFGIHKNYYFWRTSEPVPKEYDLVEDYNGEFEVFEMKWSSKKESQVKKYPIFFETYPKSTLSVIHNENWWQYLV